MPTAGEGRDAATVALEKRALFRNATGFKRVLLLAAALMTDRKACILKKFRSMVSVLNGK